MKTITFDLDLLLLAGIALATGIGLAYCLRELSRLDGQQQALRGLVILRAAAEATHEAPPNGG